MTLKKMNKNKNIKLPCQHYWIIEPPGAETSLGICKFCGKHKRFSNSYQYSSLEKSVKKHIPADLEAVSS